MRKQKEKKQKKKDFEEEYNTEDEMEEINSNRAVFRKYPELYSDNKWPKD